MRALAEMWREIMERPDGPFAFRFYLQPVMAMAWAIRDGVRDARTGRPAYLWSLFTDATHRRERLAHGWRSIRSVFLLAVGMDLAYQLVVLRGLRPVETLLVAVALAIVPYALARGPVGRLAARLAHRRAAAN